DPSPMQTSSTALLRSAYGASSFLISFFPSSAGRHRHLPSFPTRRSSDLLALDPELERILRTISPKAGEIGAIEPGLAERLLHERSEEHTSELQSRENLVCRLLLEKKKPVTARRSRAGRSSL